MEPPTVDQPEPKKFYVMGGQAFRPISGIETAAAACSAIFFGAIFQLIMPGDLGARIAVLFLLNCLMRAGLRPLTPSGMAWVIATIVLTNTGLKNIAAALAS